MSCIVWFACGVAVGLVGGLLITLNNLRRARALKAEIQELVESVDEKWRALDDLIRKLQQ